MRNWHPTEKQVRPPREKAAIAASGPMFFPLRRRRSSPNRALIARLCTESVAAVRRPAFYLDYGVPDTFEGRFELLALHAGLVLRRFNRAEAPGPAVAQELVDGVFANLEADLREAGVGDVTVPKRMKTLAEAFLGRSAAYDAALRRCDDTLTAVVSRNVYAGRLDPAGAQAARMTRYVELTAERLDASPLAECLAGPLPFPDPLSVTV